MIKQQIISSLRFISGNKLVTAINAAGLTVSITFAILIGIYVKKELSVDKSFSKKDRIWRLEIQYPERNPGAVMVSAVGPDLKNSISSIEDVVRIQVWGNLILKKADRDYYSIPRVCLADSGFFNLFEQTWIYGTPENALTRPLSIVLTDEFARKIFGDVNPVGLNLFSQSGISAFVVTGVIKKRDDDHFQYNALLSMVTRGLESSTILHTYSTQQWLTYFLVREGIDHEILEKQIYEQLLMLFPSSDGESVNRNFIVILNPLDEIYFDRKTRDMTVIHGNRALVTLFTASAFLILLIACINFINLSTAGALKRSREVGLRKIIGSDRKTLVIQFMAETFIIISLSALLALILATALLPGFNNLTGADFDFTWLYDKHTIPALLIIIAVTGVLAGLYPALFISSFEPIIAIKGEPADFHKSFSFRRILILFQFIISVFLINGSLLISKQLKYTREKDLGFEKERILTVDLPASVLRNRDIVRERLLDNNEITGVTFSYTVPGGSLNYEGFIINEKTVNPQVFSIDPYYIDTYGLEVKAGRGFDRNIGSDSVSNCIINETLAKMIGLEDPLNGTFIHDSWYITMFPVKNIRIIGVVKDFHFKSFRTTIEPLMLAWNPGWFNYVNIKIADGKTGPAMERIRKVMEEYAPGFPMEYEFIEDSFDRMYKSDERMGKIFIWFTLLAILISILGIVGMAVFASEKRVREVAIRKTFGAPVTSVVALFSGEFVLLALLANVIGAPLFIWLARIWLNDFVYKTSIGSSVLFITLFISIAVALLTVMAVIWRAAASNPADSLRHQ